jgi:hypothetical protein
LSSIEIINHVNSTLFNILRESFAESLGQDLNITVGSPADEDGSGDHAPRLYIFLYNIVEDAFSKNRQREFRGGARLLSFKPPLTLNLYYMLTPFSAPRSSTTPDPPERVQGHTMIALAMQAFYNNALVNPKYFPRNTTLGESQVRISSVQMNLEEITKIWSSFNKPFQMSVCYEVSVVQIQSEETPKEVHVVERAAFPTGASSGAGGGSESEFEVVPAIGKRNLSKLKDKGWNLSAMRSGGDIGDISNVRPVAVQPGMALSIYGRNFKGKKLTVKIGDKTIIDGTEIITGEKTIIDGREIDAESDKEVNKAIDEGREINATLLRTLLKILWERLLGTSSGVDDAKIKAEVDKVISGSQEINATLLRTLLKIVLARLLEISFRVINENLIKVKISPNEKPGNKKLLLSLASEGEEGEEEASTVVTTIFEVLPPEPSLIRITDVRPDKGISGDLITIYGINFTEDVKVSIGATEVTKVTFVDNTQINIMIPPGMAPAMTQLNVKTDQETASIPFRIL